jgi:hypothetical protein
MSLADPTGFLLTTIRDFPAVAALTTRVRCPEPMGQTSNAAGVVTDAGDARGPGKYVRFVVLTRLGRTRLPRAPIQEVRYITKCYGQGGNPAQDADTLAAAVSDSIHAAGHRINGAGVSIFGSFDDGGEGAVKDPDTDQPHSDIVISVGASTALIT